MNSLVIFTKNASSDYGWLGKNNDELFGVDRYDRATLAHALFQVMAYLAAYSSNGPWTTDFFFSN